MSVFAVVLFQFLFLFPGSVSFYDPGPSRIHLWRVSMSEDRKASSPAESASPTSTPPITTRELSIQLKEFSDPGKEDFCDDYCHRDALKLTPAYLEDVVESMRQEKQLELVQVFRGADGRWQILTGHRRIAAMFILALEGAPGFSLNMAVAAREVIGGTLQDRLVRSVADNNVRLGNDQKERLLIVEKFDKAGVPKGRGAAASRQPVRAVGCRRLEPSFDRTTSAAVLRSA
jgi:hypothetical protein